MKFEEILQPLREGKEVTRSQWVFIEYMHCLHEGMEIHVDGKFIPYVLSNNDLFADDWELINR